MKMMMIPRMAAIPFLSLLLLLHSVFCQPPPQLKEAKRGSAIVMVKYEEPTVGLRVAAAGDRMQSHYYPEVFDPLIGHWKEQRKRGQLSADQEDRLVNIVMHGRSLIAGNDGARRKVQYMPSANGHWAIGFTGDQRYQLEFVRNADKSDARTAQDFAHLLDTAYRKVNMDMGKEAESGSRKTYLATNGYDIYDIKVGGRTRPKALKLGGNVHVDGWGGETMQKKMESVYGGPNSDPRRMASGEVQRNLRAGYAEHARHLLDPRRPYRPANTVSASYDAYVMGEDPGQVDMVRHEDAEEVARIGRLREVPMERIVEDIVREGGWDERFGAQSPVLGQIHRQLVNRWRADEQMAPTAEEGGDPRERANARDDCRMSASGRRADCSGASTSAGSKNEKKKKGPARSGGKVPPTPSKDVPKRRRGGREGGKRLKAKNSTNFKKTKNNRGNSGGGGGRRRG